MTADVLNPWRLENIEGHLVSPRTTARGALSPSFTAKALRPGEVRGPILVCEQPGATGTREFDLVWRNCCLSYLYGQMGLCAFHKHATLRRSGQGA